MAVTAGPRAVVDDFYRRLNAGERDSAAFFHPEVEWHWPPETPGASVFHGLDGIDQGIAMWAESWGEFRMEPVELIEEGDEVLALVQYRLRGAGSGIDMEQPVAHLMRVEDGLIRAWWMFGDPEKARRRFLAGDRPS
jgi:ketosteroid isomerase-like protein